MESLFSGTGKKGEGLRNMKKNVGVGSSPGFYLLPTFSLDVPLGVRLEGFLTAGCAEVIGLSIVSSPVFGCPFIHFHSTNRISCHFFSPPFQRELIGFYLEYDGVILARLSRLAFVTTDMELMAIHSSAIAGWSNPRIAIGMATVL